MTRNALEATRQPRAAGNSHSELSSTSASTQHRKARRASVTPIAQRRPCRNRSRKGPINGATMANGAMVSSRNWATCGRAWSVGRVKNKRPGQRHRDRGVAGRGQELQVRQPGQPALAGPTRQGVAVHRPGPALDLAADEPATGGHGARGALPEVVLHGIHCTPSVRRVADLRSVRASTAGRVPGTEADGYGRMGRMAASTRTIKPDAACLAAVDLAREAAVEAAGVMGVGDHLGAAAEDDRVVSHFFACPHPGYRGWRWSVTVARASRARVVTVDEVVLLPGEGALAAPDWVPWADRIQPGDVTSGLLMPAAADDVRLEPGYTGGESAADADPAEESLARAVVAELGLGRERVLSQAGRDEAAERWLAGPGGPDNQMTKQAPEVCETCGFFVRLQGQLGVLFGACSNAYSASEALGGERRPRLRSPLERAHRGPRRGAARPGLGDHRVGRPDLAVRLSWPWPTGSRRT